MGSSTRTRGPSGEKVVSCHSVCQRSPKRYSFVSRVVGSEVPTWSDFLRKKVPGSIVPRFHRRLFISTTERLLWFQPSLTSNEATILACLKRDPARWLENLDESGYVKTGEIMWRNADIFRTQISSGLLKIQSGIASLLLAARLKLIMTLLLMITRREKEHL